MKRNFKLAQDFLRKWFCTLNSVNSIISVNTLTDISTAKQFEHYHKQGLLLKKEQSAPGKAEYILSDAGRKLLGN